MRIVQTLSVLFAAAVAGWLAHHSTAFTAWNGARTPFLVLAILTALLTAAAGWTMLSADRRTSLPRRIHTE